jgi:hypothetical protein
MTLMGIFPCQYTVGTNDKRTGSCSVMSCQHTPTNNNVLPAHPKDGTTVAQSPCQHTCRTTSTHNLLQTQAAVRRSPNTHAGQTSVAPAGSTACPSSKVPSLNCPAATSWGGDPGPWPHCCLQGQHACSCMHHMANTDSSRDPAVKAVLSLSATSCRRQWPHNTFPRTRASTAVAAGQLPGSAPRTASLHTAYYAAVW